MSRQPWAASLHPLNEALPRLTDEALARVRPRRALLRVDLNLPIEEGQILDDRRLRAIQPTVAHLLAAGCRVILCSHLGRPEGGDPALSLRSLLPLLERHLGESVAFLPDILHPERLPAQVDTSPQRLILLENLRFHPGEVTGSPDFAAALAVLGDCYVNDAFGTLHRDHASLVALPHCFDATHRFVGHLIEREFAAYRDALRTAAAPSVLILGCASVRDKLTLLRQSLPFVQHMLMGGLASFAMHAAAGNRIGDTPVRPDELAAAQEVFALAAQVGTQIHLPLDYRCSPVFEEREPLIHASEQVPAGLFALDIGPRTAQHYADVLANAAFIFWNGPPGVFTFPSFAQGTQALLRALERGEGTVIVGGGDSSAAVALFSDPAHFTHVSTGGGASLRLLEGSGFPPLDALRAPAHEPGAPHD